MKKTVYEQFIGDADVIKAKQILLEKHRFYQQKLKHGPSSSQSSKAQYDLLIECCSKLRGGSLYYPYLGSGFGSGAKVELVDGSVVYDFISGIGVHWGHGDLDVLSAALDASLMDVVMQGNLQQNAHVVPLMESLTKLSGLDHCFLTTSGAMACENGLKIAFQNKFPKSRVLAFEHCFMGRTLALSHITDKSQYREGLPNTLNVDYIPFFDSENPKESIKKSLQVLDTYLKRYPGEYAVMCMEMVQGEGGYYPGDKEFFKAIIKRLKEEDILVFVDEIQTFGRTENLFAYQLFGLEKEVDIVTVGKLLQVCATLFKHNLKPKPGLISQTFIGSSTSIAVALKILELFETKKLLGKKGKTSKLSHYMMQGLSALSKKYPTKIKGPFGIGSMIAFTPFEGNKDKVVNALKLLFQKGVIGFLAGSNPTRIRFLLPVGVIDESDIDRVLNIVEEVLNSI